MESLAFGYFGFNIIILIVTCSFLWLTMKKLPFVARARAKPKKLLCVSMTTTKALIYVQISHKRFQQINECVTHKSRTIHYVLCHQHSNAKHGMQRMANAIQLDHHSQWECTSVFTRTETITCLIRNTQNTKQTIFQSEKLLDLSTPCTHIGFNPVYTNAHTHIELHWCQVKHSVLAPNLIKFNFPVSSKVLHCSLFCRSIFHFILSSRAQSSSVTLRLQRIKSAQIHVQLRTNIIRGFRASLETKWCSVWNWNSFPAWWT